MSRNGTPPEEGAVAIVTAIILTVLIGFAALVIDLGLVRADVRSSQSAADAAVTAAGLELDPTEPDAFQAACVAGWQYFLANINSDPTTPDPCDNFADTVFSQGGTMTCEDRASGGQPATDDPAIERPLYVEEVHGDFVFYMQMPVPDNDPLMSGQPSNAEFDGDDPCERIGLRIRRNRDNLLGGVIGFSNSASTVDAVARRVQGGTIKEFATLITLEPTECTAVGASGFGGGVIVFNAENPDPPPPVTPGVITADTNAVDCGKPERNFTTGGGNYICAGVTPTAGWSDADHFAAAAAIAAAGQCDVAETEIVDDTLRSFTTNSSKWTSGAAGSIAPTVISSGKRTTRQPVDHAYNCLGSYPPADIAAPNQYFIQDGNEPVIPGCSDRNIAAIDTLIGAFITTPVVQRNGAGVPANGFVEVDCVPDPANLSDPDNGLPTVTAQRVIVNCSGATQLDLVDAEVVVVERYAGGGQKGIKLTGGDRFTITPPADKDAIMVVPEDGITVTGGTLSLTRTFAYMDAGSGSQSGLQTNSSDPFTWTAPENTGWDDSTTPHKTVGCNKYKIGTQNAPTAACFEDLAMWSNSKAGHNFQGQANVNVEGVFFAPNSGRGSGTDYFKLAGGGPGLDLRDAQFFTYQLNIGAGTAVLMRPDPDRFVGTPAFGVGLIR